MSEATLSTSDRFGQEKYLNLETFKRSGQGVPTPVWFVVENGMLYVSAPSHTGKVKRLRNNKHVRVVACDGSGKKNKGDWVDGEAEFLSGGAAEHADHLLDAKYGWQKKMLDLFGKFKKWNYTLIAIRL